MNYICLYQGMCCIRISYLLARANFFFFLIIGILVFFINATDARKLSVACTTTIVHQHSSWKREIFTLSRLRSLERQCVSPPTPGPSSRSNSIRRNFTADFIFDFLLSFINQDMTYPFQSLYLNEDGDAEIVICRIRSAIFCLRPHISYSHVGPIILLFCFKSFQQLYCRPIRSLRFIAVRHN